MNKWVGIKQWLIMNEFVYNPDLMLLLGWGQNYYCIFYFRNTSYFISVT